MLRPILFVASLMETRIDEELYFQYWPESQENNYFCNMAKMITKRESTQLVASLPPTTMYMTSDDENILSPCKVSTNTFRKLF